MPSFSCRWGLPSCRRKEDNRDRCRGRRPGNAATCRARLKGWIRNVAERSPIWGDVDLKAFCAATGYSREHATRELSKLRRESGFAFETKLRSKRGSKTNTWGVIVADPEKLRFDRRSLFYDRHGNRLHNYTTLADGGEKIAPTIIFPVPERRPRGRPRTRPVVSEVQKRPRGRPRKQCATPLPVAETVAQESPLAPILAQVLADSTELKKYLEIPQRCDNPLTKDSCGIQQSDLYGAVRGVVLSRGREGRTAKPQALQRKAFALQARLAGCHWDNCKVRFSRRTAHRAQLRLSSALRWARRVAHHGLLREGAVRLPRARRGPGGEQRKNRGLQSVLDHLEGGCAARQGRFGSSGANGPVVFQSCNTGRPVSRPR